MRSLHACLFAGCLSMTMGCGSGDWGYVEGTVTVDGQPVGPGVVHFQPANPGPTGGALGEFDTDGKYTARSSGRKEGLLPGDYVVTVTEGGLAEVDDQTRPAKAQQIPARYTNVRTSDLTLTVESGRQAYDIDLKP
jgi:hypothetical protein